MRLSNVDCDPEVFEKGQHLCTVDGIARDVEPWVKKVAERCGQRMDWIYTKGKALVLVLGDFKLAMQAVNDLEPELVALPVPEERQHQIQYREPKIFARYHQ